MVIQNSQSENQKLLRIWHIVGDRKKGIDPLIPIGRTTFLNGVKSGKYPRGFLIGERTRVWRADDIEKIIIELGQTA